MVWLPTSRPAVSSATRPAVKTRLPATTAWLMRGPLSMRVMVMVLSFQVRYWTPGITQSISKSRNAAVIAVLPEGS